MVTCVSASLHCRAELYCIQWTYHSLSIHLFGGYEQCCYEWCCCELFFFFFLAVNSCVHTFVWAYIFDSLVCSEYLSLIRYMICKYFPSFYGLSFHFFFWSGARGSAHSMACGISIPWPGIEPSPPSVEVWSLKPWTVREVPLFSLF